MRDTLETFADEPDVGALLMIMTPQPAMEHLAEIMRDIGSKRGVPAILCNKAGSMVRDQLEADALETGAITRLWMIAIGFRGPDAYRQFQIEEVTQETGDALAPTIVRRHRRCRQVRLQSLGLKPCCGRCTRHP